MSDKTARALHPEYAQMAEEMIFGHAPDFKVVLDTLKAIEDTINRGV